MELRYICYPLLVRSVGMEITPKEIRRDLTNFTLVRTVFLYSNTASDAHFFHQTLHRFVIKQDVSLAKFSCNTAISISSLVFVIYCCYFFLCRRIFIWIFTLFKMVVECSSRELRNLQQHSQRVFSP